ALALIPVLVLAALEAGWAGNLAVGTMPTARPALDRPIAADHSGSIVVDVPFGVRGGGPLARGGGAFDPEAQVLPTPDGHRPPARGRLPVPAAQARADGGAAEPVLRRTAECPGAAARPRRVGGRLPQLPGPARRRARRGAPDGRRLGHRLATVPGCPALPGED